MSDTMIGLASAALAAAVILIWLVYRQRRIRTRRLMKGLLSAYFNGDVPVDQLGLRSREIASRRFLGGPQFYSLAIAAFQSAFDAKFADKAHLNEDESRLVRRLAQLKREFGLTDRYRYEGRPGRE